MMQIPLDCHQSVQVAEGNCGGFRHSPFPNDSPETEETPPKPVVDCWVYHFKKKTQPHMNHRNVTSHPWNPGVRTAGYHHLGNVWLKNRRHGLPPNQIQIVLVEPFSFLFGGFLSHGVPP